MDATIGFITLNNINKSSEFLIFYFMIACGSIIEFKYFMKEYQFVDFKFQESQLSDIIITFVVLSIAFLLVFKYLSEKYNYKSVEENIFAILSSGSRYAK